MKFSKSNNQVSLFIDEVDIFKVHNIIVHYENEEIILPEAYDKKVKQHWKKILDSGKKTFNGDVFSIYKVEAKENCIDIYARLTDYTHFLYLTFFEILYHKMIIHF